MSSSVTPTAPGASNTLALLQALSSQAPSGLASSSGALQATLSPRAPSLSVSTSAAAGAQSLFATAEGVGQALSLADAADAAGQGVVGLLQQLHATATEAADPSTSADQRAALDAQFQATAGQIAPTLAGATVNGANLVDGSQSSPLKVALGQGASGSLTPVDLTPGGPNLALPAGASIATAEGAASAVDSLNAAIGGASAGLSTLQTQADQIGAHASFVQTLGQALATPGVASPDQDGGDSVRLLALQASQQLSAQPSAIANQSPQAILSLFRS